MRSLDEFNIIHLSFFLFGIETILHEQYEIVYYNINKLWIYQHGLVVG